MNLYKFIRQHYQFALMLVLWSISGIYFSPSYLVVIPVSLLLLKSKNMYVEMICGMFYVIILSDSWSPYMKWAGNVKDIYIIMLVLFYVFDQKKFSGKEQAVYPFIPFLVIAFIVTFRTPAIIEGFEKYISYVLVFAIIPNYYSKLLAQERERFLQGLIYTAACLLIYSYLLIAINYNAAYLYGRFRGVMGNPNGLGIFCTVFFAFFTIVTGKFKNLFSKNETVFIYGIILLSVILSNSRNAILSILIFYTFLHFFKVSYWLGFSLIILIAVSYQLIMLNLPAIITALGLQQYMRVEHLEDGSGRIAAWIFGWQKIQENFLIGKGFNYEGWLYKQYAEYLLALGHIGNAHNSYLAIWLNEGIIGLVCFVYALIYRFVKASAKSVYALPLMYCVIFSATFESWLVGSLNPHTPLLLLMWTLMTYDMKEELPENKLSFDKYKIPPLAS